MTEKDQADVVLSRKAVFVRCCLKEWNAFALNFREKEIAPYSVYVIGKAQGGIENILAGSGAKIEIEIR